MAEKRRRGDLSEGNETWCTLYNPSCYASQSAGSGPQGPLAKIQQREAFLQGPIILRGHTLLLVSWNLEGPGTPFLPFFVLWVFGLSTDLGREICGRVRAGGSVGQRVPCQAGSHICVFTSSHEPLLLRHTETVSFSSHLPVQGPLIDSWGWRVAGREMLCVCTTYPINPDLLFVTDLQFHGDLRSL